MSSIELYVPVGYETKSLMNFKWDGYANLKKAVMSCVKVQEVKGLFLFGDPGIGKSHLLVAMFREFVAKQELDVGADVFFISWTDLMGEVTEVMKCGGMAEQLADKLSRIRVVIIDDMRVSWSRIGKDVFKRLIERMYEQQGKLILSANVESMEDLVSKWELEDYWVSRLKDLVVCVKMKGIDRRGAKSV